MPVVVNVTPQANGRLPGRNGIHKHYMPFWAVGEDKIVEETPSGRYTITDCAFLDLQGLTRVHAVLGYILSHEAVDEELEPKPSF